MCVHDGTCSRSSGSGDYSFTEDAYIHPFFPWGFDHSSPGLVSGRITVSRLVPPSSRIEGRGSMHRQEKRSMSTQACKARMVARRTLYLLVYRKMFVRSELMLSLRAHRGDLFMQVYVRLSQSVGPHQPSACPTFLLSPIRMYVGVCVVSLAHDSERTHLCCPSLGVSPPSMSTLPPASWRSSAHRVAFRPRQGESGGTRPLPICPLYLH